MMRTIGHYVVELLTITFVIVLAFGTLFLTHLYGQSGPTPRIRPSPPPAAPANQGDAQPVAGQPAVSDSKSIGDWLFSCVTVADKKQCSITQRMVNKSTNAVVFAWTIARDTNGNLVSIWDTPTGVLVNQGVAIDVGGDKPLLIPYRACTAQQCQAAANLAPPFVKELTSVPKATATIVSIAGKAVTFNFSLNGFSEALAALQP